jgi:hypothetical protein
MPAYASHRFVNFALSVVQVVAAVSLLQRRGRVLIELLLLASYLWLFLRTYLLALAYRRS